MMSKKILAVLLSLSMISSAVGMPVFADEIEAETAEVLEMVEAEETEEVSILSEEDESVSEETEDYNIRLMANEATYYSDYGVYFDKSTGTITDADEKFTNFNIPEKIDGTFVTQIGEQAFSDCILATNISLPNTIEKIGYMAFKNCTSLTELTIPPYADASSSYYGYYGKWIYGCTKLKTVNIAEGTTKIPRSAFSDCVDFNSIVIPDTVTSVGDYAFMNCTQLTALPTMKSVTVIGNYAFSGCSGISDITNLPSSLKQIGNYAFEKCIGIKQISNLPSQIENLGNGAFSDCMGLETVELSGNLFESIGEYAFKNCKSLKDIELPEKLTGLGYRAFENCTSLTSIEIPKYANTISSYYGYYGNWLYGCTELKTVKLAEGATTIPRAAFANCVYFSDIQIPNTVVTIGNGAFQNCTQLKEIPTMNGVTSIEQYAFSGCTNIENLLNLPSKLTTIDNYAFENCTSLVTINNLPSKIESIGNGVFSGCIGIENVELSGNRFKHIGEYAFSNCKSLKAIQLPQRLEELGYRAFENCTSLTSIEIPENTDTISSYYGYYGNWLYGCTELKTVKLAEGATAIPRAAFANCVYFSDILIPDTVVTIGNNAFQNCTQLTEIPSMNGVTSIGNYAFSGCTNLESLDNLPSTLEIIGNYAFENCTGLETVNVLPTSLKTIGSYAFSGCKYLEKVVLPLNLEKINENAFQNNTYLEYIFIPESVTSIGKNVFNGDSDVTIYGMSPSTAETYATTNNIPFVTLTEPPVVDVPVKSISLNKTSTSIQKGATETLEVTFTPASATNKNIIWTSSDTDIATVSNGKVTAKSVGTAIITAKSEDGDFSSTCSVTVTDNGSQPDNPNPPVTDGAVVKVSSVTASAGNTVNVTVDLSGNKGFANLGIQVGYDANNLTLTSVTNNASVGATYTGAQSITANPYNMGWDSTNNITYNGNLATLTFKVKENAAEGKYPITVSYYKGISGNYTDGEDVNYDADFNSLGLSYVNGAITISSHIAGDINGDGKVNNQDGTFLLRHLAGWNVNIDESALDVNGDGRVNNQDGTVLLRYLAGWSVTIH